MVACLGLAILVITSLVSGSTITTVARVVAAALLGVGLSNAITSALSEEPEERLERMLALLQLNLAEVKPMTTEETKLSQHYYKTKDPNGWFWVRIEHHWVQMPGGTILYSRSCGQNRTGARKWYDCYLLKPRGTFLLVMHDRDSESETTGVSVLSRGAEATTLHGVQLHTTWAGEVSFDPVFLTKRTAPGKGPVLDSELNTTFLEDEWKKHVKIDGISIERAP